MSEDYLSRPHDALFKHVFSQAEPAEGELKAALPAEVSKHIDWGTLFAVDGTVVDRELRDTESDLIFEVELRGRPAWLYVLLEHQSEPDPMMAYRLLRYMVRLWERWRRDHAEAGRLPAILPVVMHHGRAGWRVARSFHEQLDVPPDVLPDLAAYLPSFSYVVDDLSDHAVEDLQERAMVAAAKLALICLKRARDTDDMLGELRRVEALVTEVLAASNGVDAFAAVVSYVLSVTEVESEDLRAFAQRLGPRGTEAYMTGAQQLIQKGREEGLQEGLQEGRVAEAVEAVRRVLAARSLQLSEVGERRLSGTTDLEELRRLHERAVVVEAADDIFS